MLHLGQRKRNENAAYHIIKSRINSWITSYHSHQNIWYSHNNINIITTVWLTTQLTITVPWAEPCSRSYQSFKTFQQFYATWKFVRTFKRAYYCFLSWTKSSPHPFLFISFRIYFITIISCRLGPPSGLSPSDFLSKFCMHISSPPCMPHAISISFFLFRSKCTNSTCLSMGTVISKQSSGILFHS